MGVLVGTALIVILPEGVETLYSASSSSGHTRRALSTASYVEPILLARVMALVRKDTADVDAFLTPGPIIADAGQVSPATPTMPGVGGILGEGEGLESDGKTDHTETAHHDESPHTWMGLALIMGFVLMFLIDKLPHYLSRSKQNSRPYHISLTNLGRRSNRAPSAADEEADNFLDAPNAVAKEASRSFATTTGLVIHAAADGIALGASTSASSSRLSFIIFFAIMVHKAPAAFGLTSVLLKQGLSKRSARFHLLLFSMAAPAGALLTSAFAYTLGASTVDNADKANWWTGMLLLFSAGTFLYVAMHTMQDDSHEHDPVMNGHANGSLDGREAPKHAERVPITELLAAVLGMILPLFLQVGHAH